MLDDLLGFGKHVLTDEKFPDPVVPPDLHLIKPAVVDADGRVECIYCKHPVAFAQASLIGSDGYSCPTCVARFTPPAALPDDVKIRRGPVPYLIAGGVVATVVAIVVIAVKFSW